MPFNKNLKKGAIKLEKNVLVKTYRLNDASFYKYLTIIYCYFLKEQLITE